MRRTKRNLSTRQLLSTEYNYPARPPAINCVTKDISVVTFWNHEGGMCVPLREKGLEMLERQELRARLAYRREV